MSLQRFLSTVDVFSNPFYFKVYGNDKLGTKAGFCLTLVSITIGIVAFILQLNEMQQMKDPIVNTQTIQTLTGQSFNIKPNHFNNVVGMADRFYSPIYNTMSKTYFTIHYEICDFGNCTIVNTERCSEGLSEIVQQEFGADIQYFKFSYCMNQTYQNTSTIKLSGGIFSIKNSRVFIVTSKCVNSTDNDYICATEEEMNDKLLGSYIVYGMEDFRFEPDNVYQPFTPFYYMTVQEVVLGNPISLYFNYQISSTITKTNFYFFYPEESQVDQIQIQTSFQDKQTKNDIVLGRGIVVLSNDKLIRTRSYKNILSLFGTLGGLMNIVFYIAKILIVPINWLEQRFYLYNSVLRYEHLEDYLKLNENFKLPQMRFWDLLTKPKLRKKFFSDYQQILPKLEISHLINQIQLSTRFSESFIKGDLMKYNYDDSKPRIETKQKEINWKDQQNENVEDSKHKKVQEIQWESIPNEK